MENCVPGADESRRARHWLRICSPAILALTALATLLQPGCLFRKKPSTPKYPASPIPIVLLPFNVPSDNAELRWVSLGGAVMIAKELEQAKDLEVVPLWETLPVAVETLGNSRTITPEISGLIAGRLNARWAAQSEVTPGQSGLDLLIDFIPAKATLIPFRYQSRTQLDSLTTNLRQAFEQFLRYMVARPLGGKDRGSRSIEPNQLRELAAALDREYGWFAAPDPGKAGQEAERLARSDSRLARLLFSPTLYPGSNERPVSSSPQPSGNPAPAAVEQPRQPAPPSNTEARGAPATTSAPEPPQPSTPPVTLPSEIPPPPARTETEPRTAPTGETSATPTKSSKAAARSRAESCRIQVHSSRSKEDADALAAKLTKAGFSPEIERVDLKEKGIWYRIRLEIQGSRKVAEETGRKLVGDGIIGDFWVVP